MYASGGENPDFLMPTIKCVILRPPMLHVRRKGKVKLPYLTFSVRRNDGAHPVRARAWLKKADFALLVRHVRVD